MIDDLPLSQGGLGKGTRNGKRGQMPDSLIPDLKYASSYNVSYDRKRVVQTQHMAENREPIRVFHLSDLSAQVGHARLQNLGDRMEYDNWGRERL